MDRVAVLKMIDKGDLRIPTMWMSTLYDDLGRCCNTESCS